MRQKLKARGLSEAITVESRGTGDWHVGQPADRRMRATASSHGLEMDTVAEHFEPADYGFDLILSMDAERQAELVHSAPSAEAAARIVPFRRFDPAGGDDADVPDPYYGGQSGFEEVWEIVDRSCDALIDALLDGSYKGA